MNRFTTLPFPEYTYVPGQSPHPRSHPQGHSHGLPDPMALDFNPSRWANCEQYLFGIDLFNHQYYWEAHEQWEAVWLCVGRAGPVADFLKGLIKLSAAGVKAKEANPVGVERHLKRAVQLLSSVGTKFEGLAGFGMRRLVDQVQAETVEHIVETGRLELCLSPESAAN